MSNRVILHHRQLSIYHLQLKICVLPGFELPMLVDAYLPAVAEPMQNVTGYCSIIDKMIHTFDFFMISGV